MTGDQEEHQLSEESMERQRSPEVARDIEREPAASTSAPDAVRRTLIRHSKHVDNVLMPGGIAIAEARREAMGNPRFDLILASRQPRTAATGLIISPRTPLVIVPELYPDPELHPAIRVQAIMATYAEGESFALVECLKRLGIEPILAFGDAAAAGIEFETENHDARNVLIIDDGLLISAIGLSYLTPGEPPRPPEIDAILHTPLKECEGFVIHSADTSFNETGIEWIGATPVYRTQPAS